jgi:hypothetical protein
VPALLPRSRSGTSDSPQLKGCNPVPTCQSAGNIFPRKPLQRWRNRLGGSSPQPSTQLFGQPTSASGTSRSSIWGKPVLASCFILARRGHRLFSVPPECSSVCSLAALARLQPMAWIDGSGNAS